MYNTITIKKEEKTTRGLTKVVMTLPPTVLLIEKSGKIVGDRDERNVDSIISVVTTSIY